MNEPRGHYAKGNKPDTESQNYIISLLLLFLKSSTSNNRGSMVGARGWGEVVMESYCLMGRASICKMRRVLEMGGNDGCKIIWRYLIPRNCTLKTVKIVILYYIYFTTVKKIEKRSMHSFSVILYLHQPEHKNVCDLCICVYVCNMYAYIIFQCTGMTSLLSVTIAQYFMAWFYCNLFHRIPTGRILCFLFFVQLHFSYSSAMNNSKNTHLCSSKRDAIQYWLTAGSGIRCMGSNSDSHTY